ncbi:MAG: ABC transporter permease [Candidatus Eisenbacteria bacterium]|nr:ABC transporter permease [Candidatus Eisenbacteria bacterium]
MSEPTGAAVRNRALFLENLRQAIEVIRTHRLRSSLLILGVGIGVAAILAVVTILVGLGAQIEHDMTLADRPYIMVARFDMLTEGAGEEELRNRKRIEPEAAEAVRQYCDAVSHIDFRYDPDGRMRVIQRGGEHTQPVKVIGTSEAFPLIHAFTVADGRFFTRTELEHNRSVIVLAWGPAKDLFPHSDPIGERVRIGTHNYEVVGVFEERKHIMGQLGEGYAVVPYTSYERDFHNRYDESYLVVSPAPGRTLEETREQLIATLRAARKVPPGRENDFAVMTSEAFRETVGRITGAIALVLVAISSIGLLVGGIGVMNIMLISVTERTHEVGLRMSVGARRSDVLFQFLIEATTLTGLGGAVGVGLGILAAQGISRATGFPLGVSPFWIAVSVLFSALVGLVFGIFPANRAARMDPIDALRYEK